MEEFLNKPNFDVNLEIKNILGHPLTDGPAIIIAILLGRIEPIKMLVQKFGANINQEIILEGRRSNLLIFAMHFIFV